MQINLASVADSTGSVDLADQVFAVDYNEALVHQVVTAYMAGGRSGTKAQKTRAEVSGSGAKPWRQKGLGRARSGSARSPIWRSGGVTFAAKPRSFAQKVNRKMYRGAMRAILSELVRRDQILVVEDLILEKPKTKDLVARLSRFSLTDVLIVTAERDDVLALASRNLHQVAVQRSAEVNPVGLLGFDKVLMTVPAVRLIERRLA